VIPISSFSRNASQLARSAAGGGGGGPHPLLSYSNLLALWDAHDISQGDSTPLSTWDSVSGSPAKTLSALGTAPTFRTASLNGDVGVSFNGTTQAMEDVAGIIARQVNFTVFVVAKPVTLVSYVNGMLNNLGSSYDRGDWWWGIASDGHTMFDVRPAAASGTNRYNATIAAFGVAGVHAAVVSNDLETSVWANGVKNTTHIAASNYGASSSLDRFRVGGQLQAGSQYYSGLIGAIAVYSDAKSDADVVSITSDLKTLWGIA